VNKEIILALHNVRSVHNVGSIFRTADAAGVSKILLSGYTPLPVDRFGRERKDFIKVSLGAEKTVPWTHTKRLGDTLRKLKKEGFQILAIEQDPKSVPLFSWRGAGRPIVLLMGNEVRGLSLQLLSCADAILEIPMHGSKESLNVSVAAGIALFSVLEKM